MNPRSWRSWARSLGAKPRAVDPYGIIAALAERKANRTAIRAQERSDAARRGWETRRAQG